MSGDVALRADVTTGRLIRLRGVVQGVGLRPWVFRLASEHGIAGEVRNDESGVTIEAFGSSAALDRFTSHLQAQPPPAAEITALDWAPLARVAPSDFHIVPSAASARRRLSAGPDIATCDACLAELGNPEDRRHRYPFTNCTNCGPRFSIVRDIPYDRGFTTMAAFTMCRACAAEYATVTDRRFHAEPNACPVCGPQLTLLGADGADLQSSDPIADAAQMIRRGAIVAIKGLGGFHLACDARSSRAVAELRQRKRRDLKPFAVMAADIAEAERLAVLDDNERGLLLSAPHPIVLVAQRRGNGLAGGVAPGNPSIGLMLPYSPLHHLLLAAFHGPLVMTSANLSEGPIAYGNEEAQLRLRGIADAFVVHDREIATRTDDSVIRVLAGRPTVLRRSRGYVPRAIPLQREVVQPILACGAQLKNAFCLAAGDEGYLSPHIGDLDDLETYASFESTIDLMERLLRVRPSVVAHDLHPDYRSTRYALQREGVRHIAVQHHHAHVASAMAERGLQGPVLGIAFDGGGYGGDGTVWGGEFLLADYAGFQRLATLRPIRLAGGDAAIRQVWRIALAAVLDAFDGAPPLHAIPLFRKIPMQVTDTASRMLVRGFNSPPAHGAGRYFDAVGALALHMPVSGYEGHVAMMLELAHDGDRRQRFSYEVDTSSLPWQIDLRPAIREVVRDVLTGVSPGAVSSTFHNTLVAATAHIVHAATERWGRHPVVLSGGCFQNGRLVAGLAGALSARFDVYRHEQVPPGDGGLALGQALVADAILRRSSGG